MVNNKNMFISVLFYSVCLVLSITTLVARANTVIPSVRLQNRLIAQALAPRLSYVVIKRYVIKPVFLQGLSYDKGMLYLSTGLYHHSAFATQQESEAKLGSPW